jgi:site-specific recombinase XerD
MEADSPSAVSDSLSPVSAPRSLAPRRKLHLGHFAFMRAVVQGIALRDSWDRYMRIEGEARDARVVRSTVAWIRNEFAAAARRESRPGTARLVLVDAAILAAGEPPLPSLEDFALERGMEDFSQEEQLAAYESEYGDAVQRARRRGRLIERQLDALRWLEDLVAEPPRASDPVEAWFGPALATRLQIAALPTLGTLIVRINGVGRLWWRPVRAIGEAKAARIEEWLRAHAPTIGIAVGRHVRPARGDLTAHDLAAVVRPATDIRPLEKFIVPSELDGSAGRFRQPAGRCLLDATNDYEAILAWIRSKHGLTPEQKASHAARRRGRAGDTTGELAWLGSLSHTQRAYRREAERFLLWGVIERGRAMSSMTQEDCVAYREFLANPRPAERWCGPRGRERWSPLWRPFEGPLAPAAQRQAITILRNLYGYLVDQNYLMGNPWAGVQLPRTSTPKVNAGRSFTRAQWDLIEAQLTMLPATSANQRLRFTLHLLYATGLRLQELVDARVGDLEWVAFPADARDDEPIEGWMLRVIGKGSRLREVPVPIDVVGELSHYLVSQGRSPDPEHPDNTGLPLLARATDFGERAPGLAGVVKDGGEGEGLAAATLYRQVKEFFTECANVLSARGDRRGGERLASASTHWMRHTHASHSIAAGMPIEIAQQNLGHASLATTTVYVTTERKARMKAVQGFWASSR